MLRDLPRITRFLLISNVCVFLTLWILSMLGNNAALPIRTLENLLSLHPFTVSLVPEGYLPAFLDVTFMPHQLFTYMFLHADFAHIFFNMFSLYMFGRVIEQVMGEKRFLIFYIVCGVGAGLCQELWQYIQFYLLDHNLVSVSSSAVAGAFAPTVGASGAVYGVLLAFGALFPNERIMLLIPPIPLKAKWFISAMIVMEIYFSFSSSGNVAHFAHLGGMLFGFLLMLYWKMIGRGNVYSGWQRWDGYEIKEKKGLWTRIKEKVGKVFERKPKMKVSQGGAQFRDRQSDYEYNKQQQQKGVDQEKINAILEKIKRSGYESLTADEKRDLFNHSRR